jgi:D-serine deaminase-like pyridoxal phosphate-dependent protein
MIDTQTPLPGTPMEELDTPCLVIDLNALDHNMDVIADYYRDRPSKLRGHSKNHKTPAIALRQIRRGGTIGGVCAAKVAEAEVMVHGGVPSVFITSEVMGDLKIRRLCSLAGQAEVMVACDSPQNAHALSREAAAQGVDLGVVIEVETGMKRCGVQEIQQGVSLAREIDSLPGISFRGIMSHQVIEAMPDREDRVIEGNRVIKGVIDLKDAIVDAGIPVEVVSTGETWSYDVAGEIPGVTEVQGGSYLLMETHYSYMTEFSYAAKVLTTIISAPRPGVAIGDAGVRCVGALRGMPEVWDRPGVTVASMDSDHAVFTLADGASLWVGDQVLLVPAQQDAMVSRWDRFVGLRNGIVEAVWDIQARGCHN